jgi:hypothetical protein
VPTNMPEESELEGVPVIADEDPVHSSGDEFYD